MSKLLEPFNFIQIDVDNVESSTLEAIHAAEADGIGTLYKNCWVCCGSDCENIFSKDELFWNVPNYKDKRVVDLFQTETVLSPCCQAPVKAYRGKDKIDVIQERLSRNVERALETPENPIDSFCVVIQHQTDGIIGMSYGNITNSLEYLYEKELAYHFTKEVLNHPKFQNVKDCPYFLTLSWTFILEKYLQQPKLAILLLKQILWEVAHAVDDKYIEAVGIFEAIVWSATQNINKKSWWDFLELHENISKYYTKPKFQDCDVAVHHDTVPSCRSLIKESSLQKINWDN